MHSRISYKMNAEDIFRSSIGCEIMIMIKARIRLIFSRYTVESAIWKDRTYFLIHPFHVSFNVEPASGVSYPLKFLTRLYKLSY